MNEIELVKTLVNASPYLALLVWLHFRQEKALDKLVDRIEKQFGANTVSLDRSAELHGRSLERLAHNEAHELRMADIVQDYTEEKRRAK